MGSSEKDQKEKSAADIQDREKGESHFAAKAVGPTGDLRNVALMNLGTFVGALCFLAGAVLLIPDEAAHQ